MSLEKSINDVASKAIEEAKKEISQRLDSKKSSILEDLNKAKSELINKVRQ